MPSEGLSAIERTVARDEIHQLAVRYAYAIDARDVDLLVSLFVPDVRVGRADSGREALRAFWVDALSGIGVSILFVGNHLIDFEDRDHASGIVYCMGRIQDALPQRKPEGGRWIEQAIQYRDNYERRDEGWLFVRRKHVLWYGVEKSGSPLEQGPANWPANQTGRGTVPEDLPSWSAFWQSVRE